MTLKEAAQILELTPPFSREDLKKAFRDALMVWHPDRFPEGTERRAKAEKRTQQLNDAYDLLSCLHDSDFPFRGEGWTESTAAASPPKHTVKKPSGMSSKQFSILIGAGIFCALLFAAPGLYELSNDYQRDTAREEGKRPKWDEITVTDEYKSLPPQAQAEVKTEWFKANLLPEVEKLDALREMGVDKVYEWFMQQPDDNGQGYSTSILGSLGRGAVAILPWCFDELATWQISPGFTEFATSVRGGVESISPVNPIHADKWPMKLAFWLGFVAPPAAFFAIRVRQRKGAAPKPSVK
jgi:hypothetical protein